ncbi:hypothetical protein [Ornithinibacillus xuwenensis]|uniref:YqaI-like protein n=1 Tax=Ornithinibacillus xuwenensis TaxID=3144668 RepID=A0ABU9XC06_9BACI
MDHPAVALMERTGMPPYSPRREEYGTDALGNEVFVGEEIMVLEDDFFLVEELTAQSKEILEMYGATYKIAA